MAIVANHAISMRDRKRRGDTMSTYRWKGSPMNMSIQRSVVIMLLSPLLGCASSAPPAPESMTAPGADIPAFVSFGWPEGSGNPAAETMLDANVRNAIRAQLVQKGYVEAAEQPDFRVSYQTTPFETEKKSNPIRIGIGVGTWGGNVGGGVGTSMDVGSTGGQVTQNIRLTIRAVEQKANKEVWIGTTTENIKQGLDAGAVDTAVAGTMKGFPPKRK
jgi:Domain of unknown function (DUF4136)